ncbi:hypothetical protein [Streptomyces sp. NRRL S-337]|uniref:hypothetical protein n=1 Tax=Streptomyces sp. NRRL S-337 TaxID=1463900 RepID=UPI0004C5D4D4|nr:hypothetical protein [Streptomyces sp. NRRL S-337]
MHAEDRAAVYRRHLAERPVLVVLDNAHDSAQGHTMLPPPGGSRLLVSSRRRLLAVDEAHRIGLDVLPHDAAVRLLLEAATRPGAGTGGPAGDEVARHAARIAERCGGLPLALRIAAARVRGRPPAAFADLAGWLAPGDRPGPPPHPPLFSRRPRRCLRWPAVARAATTRAVPAS